MHVHKLINTGHGQWVRWGNQNLQNAFLNNVYAVNVTMYK